jgi:nitroreductase
MKERRIVDEKDPENQHEKEPITMELYQGIEQRRTIRKFQGPATEAQLKRILAAGTQAPSGMNKQNWEFVVVDDPGIIEQIGQIKYVHNRGKAAGEAVPEEVEKVALKQRDSFKNASLVVVYCNRELADSAGPWLCIGNMGLAAVAEGLASRIARFSGDAVGQINAILHAPSQMELVAAFSVGLPAEEPAPRKLRPEGSWLHRNRFA